MEQYTVYVQSIFHCFNVTRVLSVCRMDNVKGAILLHLGDILLHYHEPGQCSLLLSACHTKENKLGATCSSTLSNICATYTLSLETEKAVAELFQNKLHCRVCCNGGIASNAMVRLCQVFLIIFGHQWSSMA